MSNRLLSALWIGAAACAMSIGTAHAAATVFGPGPARACYEAAEAGLTTFDAKVSCDEALASSLSISDRAATFVNRGVIELNEARVNAALDDFDAGIAINPELAEGYVDRGAALIMQKRYADGIKDINKGLALGAKSPQLAYFDRAIADEALGNLKAAYDDYHQALALAPDFSLASEELKRFKVVDKPSGT